MKWCLSCKRYTDSSGSAFLWTLLLAHMPPTEIEATEDSEETTCIILIPFIILCLRVVTKLLVTRRRRQRNAIHAFEMIPFNLETSTDESDEQVIFDVTAL